jgi:hypothetical protein
LIGPPQGSTSFGDGEGVHCGAHFGHRSGNGSVYLNNFDILSPPKATRWLSGHTHGPGLVRSGGARGEFRCHVIAAQGYTLAQRAHTWSRAGEVRWDEEEFRCHVIGGFPQWHQVTWPWESGVGRRLQQQSRVLVWCGRSAADTGSPGHRRQLRSHTFMGKKEITEKGTRGALPLLGQTGVH